MANNVGVTIRRSTVGGLAVGPDPGDSLLIVLVAERGLEDVPTLVTDMDSFESQFGGPLKIGNNTAAYAEGYEVLSRYFAKGSTTKRAWVVRVVGDSAVQGYLSIPDNASVEALRVHAKGTGVWANSIFISLMAGSVSGTHRLVVTSNDNAISALNTLEVFDNIAMNDESIAAVNNQSNYVQLERKNTATAAAPLATSLKALASASAGAAGVDDNAVDAADVIGSISGISRSGLKALEGRMYGRGFLCAPGLDHLTGVVTEMKTHISRFHRIVLVASAPGDNAAAAVGDATGFDDPFVWYIYPRLRVVDQLTKAIKTVGLQGHVVADHLSGVANDGPGRPVGGKAYRADRGLGLETQANGLPLVDEATAEVLAANGVMTYWDRNNTGPKLWVSRTTSREGAWIYPHAAYTYIVIADNIQRFLDELVVSAASPLFFSQVRQTIHGYLAGLAAEGAFSGVVPLENEDEDIERHAFYVRCDEGLLSSTDKQQGRIRVKMWFREQLIAETIDVVLAKRTL
jgi:hypothetical protein